MKTNLDLANTIARQVEFRSINLKEATVTSNVDPYADLAIEMVYSQEYRAYYNIPVERADNLNVVVELRLRAAPPDSDLETVSLNAGFLLTYNLPNPASRDVAALKAFAELNGPYHAWPYWRELVNTVTGRIGLSPFLIPVLKLPVKQLDEEGPAKVSESGAKSSRRRTPRKKQADTK